MRYLVPILLLAACSAEPDAPVASEVHVARTLRFAPIEDGLSQGFDLDGPGAEGCGIDDLEHPDGATGIDNSFAALMPALNATGGDALPELVQNSVTSGELLLIFETITHADGCVEVNLYRGGTAPALGTDGKILPGQTFDLDPAQPSTHLACASQQDDRLEGEGMIVRLPLNVFDESIDLTLFDGRFELIEGSDGIRQGVIGGALDIQNLRDNVYGFDAIPPALVDLFGVALDLRADLVPDENGACTAMSVVLQLETVPAFIYEDAQRP